MAKKKTCIEVALNGASTRRVQPRIPVSAREIIDEGVACIKAGAAVIHAHTLEPDTSKQNGDVDNCAAFMNGIREQVDAIVYPTVVGPPNPSNPAWLWEPTVELDLLPNDIRHRPDDETWFRCIGQVRIRTSCPCVAPCMEAVDLRLG